MDALCSCRGAATTLAKASLSSTATTTTLAKVSIEDNYASGNNHSGITNNSVHAHTDSILGFVLSSGQHYKDNNNSLRILAVLCCGIKTDDGCEIVDFDRDPWASLKVSTYRPSLLE